jgi:hypothetical protein
LNGQDNIVECAYVARNDLSTPRPFYLEKNGVDKTVQVYGINEYERHIVKLAFQELDVSIAKEVRFVNEASPLNGQENIICGGNTG